MNRHLFWSLPLFLVALLPGRGLAAEDDPLVEQVRKAIDAAKGYLLHNQQERGHWEISAEKLSHPGGQTSLVMLALLTAGVDPKEEAIKKGLEYLRTIEPDQTYVLALQTMVYTQAGHEADRDRIKRNVQVLLDSRRDSGWTYRRGFNQRPDGSNTQYALLGLHEGMRGGAKVDASVMEEIQKLMISTQQRNGGWGYVAGGGGPTMNMTIAGLSNLVITGMDLAVSRQKLNLKTGVADRCGEYDENEPVARAVDLVGTNLPPRLTPGNITGVFGNAPFYGLYGLERAGRLTGQRFLGGHDWYEIGCRYLVSVQKADGSFQGLGHLDSQTIIATGFGLLFLSKGRTPVLISKLAYGPADSGGWNNKRNDVRNLVEFCSREIFKKQPLAWQAFDVRQMDASSRDRQRQLAAELLQSPVVFFNGHDYAPRGKEEGILKEYLTNGGFVFAEACCGREDFDKDFRALMKRIFPESDLTPLPADHPIWSASGKFGIEPDSWPLEGIRHGCKWVVIYSPKPLAGYWEADLYKDGRGRKAFQLGANVIAYATGLEAPRPRLTQVEIVADDKKEHIKRNFIKVAQLRHEGDFQPAPRAMRNLMLEARKVGLDVMLETPTVSPANDRVLDFYFLYMHGRRAFSFNGPDLKHLHFRLTSGGTLLADACCGSREFDSSFRKFIETIFAEEKLKLEPIPQGDELYSKELNGLPIREVHCRRERADGKGPEAELRKVPPALEGIKINGRWVVIYSRYDLGCALDTRHASSDCLGHDYDSAVRLSRAALLYALKR